MFPLCFLHAGALAGPKHMNVEGRTVSTHRAAACCYTLEMPIHRSLPALWLAVLLSMTASGCLVRVYQPMSGFQQPVVVDPGAPNFTDVRLTVNCVQGDFLTRSETSNLCRRVGSLFENQGALVETVDNAVFGGGGVDEDRAASGAPEPTTDLVLELRARRLQGSNTSLSWIVCLGTFTILPAISESMFAQDVVIRDGTGFLLLSDTLEGRVIQRFGFGPWLGNQLMDLTRPKADRLSNEAAERHLSEDMYGRLSQLAFNAKIQWMILQESQSGGPANSATAEMP